VREMGRKEERKHSSISVETPVVRRIYEERFPERYVRGTRTEEKVWEGGIGINNGMASRTKNNIPAWGRHLKK